MKISVRALLKTVVPNFGCLQYWRALITVNTKLFVFFKIRIKKIYIFLNVV